MRGILFYVLLQSPAFAVDTIDLQLDSLHTTFFETGNIELSYSSQNAGAMGISLLVNEIHSAYFEHAFSAVFNCIEANYTIQTIKCDKGSIKISYPELDEISAEINFDIDIFDFSGELTLLVDSKWGKLHAAYTAARNRPWQLHVTTQALQISFLSRLLAASVEIFKEHVLVAGKADIQAQVSGTKDQLDEITLNVGIAGISIEGESILENVTLQLLADIKRSREGWAFKNTLSLLSGEMYIQPGIRILGDTPGFYLDSSAEIKADGTWQPGQQLLEIEEFSYEHPDIILLQGSGRFRLREEVFTGDLSLNAKTQDLGLSYPVYIQPMLLQTNFSDLELSGGIDLDLDYQNGSLEKMKLSIDDVYLDDIENRFSVSALNSRLVLDSDAEAVQSSLDWAGMSFYRLDFGSGDILLESTGKDVRVLNWKNVSILDGALIIDEFSIQNLASSDFELKLGGELQPISMESLTHALGWMIFPGKLSGEISGLKYSHNNLQLEGDILVSLFGGSLKIQELVVEDIFSSYSVLTTDIKIDKLDLEQLTDVFTFGKIEGSLSGSMKKLRLENWQPSYFEMEFATPLDDDKPHRISQKALENLNELGGGLSGTLSQGFLRFLPAYSYGRLGLSCRLFNGICELGGVEDSGKSFSILTKGGLLPPWVEVKGAGRSIKWDDLIDGLKQIAAGEVSIE